MNVPALVYVGSGELCIGRGTEVLGALLGSCVAIAVLWEEGRCAGLAHCLLPRARAGERERNMAARYIDQAVPSMLAMMGVHHKDRASLKVMLAGGAKMLGGAGVSSAVGAANIAAAHEVLAAIGVTPQQVDVGGRSGRTVRLDCATGLFTVTRIDPRQPGRANADTRFLEPYHASD